MAGSYAKTNHMANTATAHCAATSSFSTAKERLFCTLLNGTWQPGLSQCFANGLTYIIRNGAKATMARASLNHHSVEALTNSDLRIMPSHKSVRMPKPVLMSEPPDRRASCRER